MCIADDDKVADDLDSVVVDLAALWILNPKINDKVPIKKQTTASIFRVIPGTIATGSPWLVSGCGFGYDAATATSVDTKENKIKELKYSKPKPIPL